MRFFKTKKNNFSNVLTIKLHKVKSFIVTHCSFEFMSHFQNYIFKILNGFLKLYT